MSAAPLHDGFLVHKRFRYGWLSLLLVVGVGAVFYYRDQLPANLIDLAFGYGLGGLALVIMLWLAWFGVRKRSYTNGAGRLKGWLSAHVYLGIALLFLVPLHGGFEITLDIHGLAYVIVLITVFTGLFGVAFYGFYPRRVALNRQGLTFDDMVKSVAEIDLELRALAPRLSEGANDIVQAEAAKIRIGGGITLLLLRPSNRSKRARDKLVRLGIEDESHVRAEGLLERKAALIVRLQRDIQMRSRMRAWLLLHVPLSLAALAIVIAHGVGMLVFGFGSV
ncbi:MAG: hypothetical protein P8M28_06295 [Alphaproteobacteria bacterium]|nr:hypothetical protein [Alphaproteobacteria bacterium]